MRINVMDTLGVIIDVQEKLHPRVYGHEELVRNIKILIEGLNILGIPVVITEQYSKGLGKTISSIREILADYSPIEKDVFSCCDVPDFMSVLSSHKKRNIILAGEESHVCVLQTAIGLVEAGFLPIVVTDCISSRKHYSTEIALKRLLSEGVVLATYESILFELLRRSGTDAFRAISRIVK